MYLYNYTLRSGAKDKKCLFLEQNTGIVAASFDVFTLYLKSNMTHINHQCDVFVYCCNWILVSGERLSSRAPRALVVHYLLPVTNTIVKKKVELQVNAY